MRYLIICLLACILSACAQKEVSTPNFEVSFESKTYKEGDTVIFNFNGNAENIIFYPGDLGHNYDYKKRAIATGAPRLNFTTTQSYVGQANSLILLASTDFSGVYTADEVKNATWKDITSKALLATSATARASGNIDLTEFLTEDNKPVYLAFQYLGYNHATLKQPKWALTAFTVNNILADGITMPVTTAAETGWVAIDYKNPTTSWLLPSSGLPVIDGTTPNTTDPVKTNDDNEDWAISKPLNLRRANPDVSIPIKNLGSARANTYDYIYTEAGTYKVVFIGTNTSIDDQKTVIREMEITILPK